MKQICLFILTVAVTAGLLSCSRAPAVTAYTPRQIAEVMIAAQEDISALHPLEPIDDYFARYVSDIYKMSNRDITGGVIYYTSGMLADELAVFTLSERANAGDVKKTLEEYIRQRLAAFTGYAPDQAAILENGIVAQQGRHIALIICRDTDKALAAFKACFGNNPPQLPQTPAVAPPGIGEATPGSGSGADTGGQTGIQTGTPQGETPGTGPDAAQSPGETPGTAPQPPQESPPATGTGTETAAPQPPDATPAPQATPAAPQLPESAPEPVDDVYDSDAILRAWQSGNKDSLTPKNRRILEACDDVIFYLISYDMDDYQKELAIHDWIILNADYDKEANSNAPDASPDPDNDNPFGLLINGKAICTGYTYTFQLFMDLLGIECISVHGKAVTGGDHAWNMVRIGGEWYCVDVTWNDPAGLDSSRLTSANHKYFNVPSKFLRDAGHIWDESSIPEATAPKLYY